MKKAKKIAGLALMATLTIASGAYAAGNASSASIGYYDTIMYGSYVSMSGNVTVSGYVNPTYSDNSCWYGLEGTSAGMVQEVEEFPGFDGNAFIKSVSNGNYRIVLNPDGPNYSGVVATGLAQN
jgi:hypothetical protein